MDTIKSFLGYPWNKFSTKRTKYSKSKMSARNTKTNSTMPSRFTEEYVNQLHQKLSPTKYSQSLSMVDISHYTHATDHTKDGNSTFYPNNASLNKMDDCPSTLSRTSFRRSSLQTGTEYLDPTNRDEMDRGLKREIRLYNGRRKKNKSTMLAKLGRDVLKRTDSIEVKTSRRSSLTTLFRRCQSLQYKPDECIGERIRRTSVNDAYLSHCTQNVSPSSLEKIQNGILYVFRNGSMPPCGLYAFTQQLQVAKRVKPRKTLVKYWKDEILYEGLEILRCGVMCATMNESFVALVNTWRKLHQKILPTLTIMLESVEQNIKAKYDVLLGFQNDVLPYIRLADPLHISNIEEHRPILVQMVLLLSRNSASHNQSSTKQVINSSSVLQRRCSVSTTNSSLNSYHRDNDGYKSSQENFEKVLLAVLLPYLEEEQRSTLRRPSTSVLH